jgi:peptidoglycan-associated lipoprotein
MKNANLIGMFFLSMALAAGVAGCKNTPERVTVIPNTGGPTSAQATRTPTAPPPAAPPVNEPGNGGVVNPTPPPFTEQNRPIDYKEFGDLFNGPHNEDAEKFKADTIYFDFDSATIKASEQAKLQAVADYFKDNPRHEGLIIDGNCDERGTEKYNLSLGERRALAAREYLANLGVKPERIKTETHGASRPAESGHSEEAWKKNRRDEFILVTPK